MVLSHSKRHGFDAVWIRALLLIFLSTLGACYVTREHSLVGTYRAKASCITIILSLNTDHTFNQVAKTEAGEVNRQSGQWWIDSSGFVTFDRFLDFTNDFRGYGSAVAVYHAERWPRGVMMGPIIVKCPDSSYKIDYVK
jgi:hypothetical protein